MRILLSNDDGYFSPGLAALERAALTLSDDVWVVAPERKRSSMGHGLSLHDTFTMRELGQRRYACSGTPADCVIAALAWLFSDSTKPALVLSGINDGRNIGEDIAYSGTMAIAREASFWGIAAIAFSAPKNVNFDAPEMLEWLSCLVRSLGSDIGAWHRPDHWLSINLPAAAPAALRHSVPGRAKIASAIESDPTLDGVTRLRYRDGRSVRATAEDELSLLDAGYGSVYRLRWNTFVPVEDALLALVNGFLPENRVRHPISRIDRHEST